MSITAEAVKLQLERSLEAVDVVRRAAWSPPCLRSLAGLRE
jgi:hypothetical protein